MRYTEISVAARLDEMMWELRYSAGAAVKKYPKAWVHFASINKIGINPSKSHRDPPGIYFYPNSWLVGDDPSLTQFATEYPYYFIVDIAKSKSVINLGTVKMEQVVRIADANGWYDDFVRLSSDTSLIKTVHGDPIDKKILRKAGGLFYATMDYLVNVEKKHTWLKMLRGVGGLYDPRHGIIADGEPAQLCLIDKSLMAVIESGSNKDTSGRQIANLMKEIATEIGGNFSYSKKIMTISASKDGKDVTVGYDPSMGRMIYTYIAGGQKVIAKDRAYSMGGTTGDYDSYRSIIKHHLRSAFEKADGSQIDGRYWDSEKLTMLGEYLTPGHGYKQSMRNGDLTYYIVDGFGGGSFASHLSSKASGVLEVGMEVSFNSEADTEVKLTFGSDKSVREVADECLLALWKKVKPTLKPNLDLQKFAKHLKFDFARVG